MFQPLDNCCAFGAVQQKWNELAATLISFKTSELDNLMWDETILSCLKSVPPINFMEAFKNTGLVPYDRHDRLPADNFRKFDTIRQIVNGVLQAETNESVMPALVAMAERAVGSIEVDEREQADAADGDDDDDESAQSDGADDAGGVEDDDDIHPSQGSCSSWQSTNIVPPCFRPMKKFKAGTRRQEQDLVEERRVKLPVQKDTEQLAMERLELEKASKLKFDMYQKEKLTTKLDLMSKADRRKALNQMRGKKIKSVGLIKMSTLFEHQVLLEFAEKKLADEVSSRRQKKRAPQQEAGPQQQIPPATVAQEQEVVEAEEPQAPVDTPPLSPPILTGGSAGHRAAGESKQMAFVASAPDHGDDYVSGDEPPPKKSKSGRQLKASKKLVGFVTTAK